MSRARIPATRGATRGAIRGAIRGLVLWALALAAHAATAAAPPIVLDEKQALEISQAAIGRAVRDGAFVRADGKRLRLADFRGKPLIVNLVYTGCSEACPVVIETLHRNLEIAQDALGEKSFAVVTIGFDTRHDTPARMRAFARARGAKRPNWFFLSGDRETVNRLAADTGFVFRASAGGFVHATQTTIVDAEGKVYRQVYGGGFQAPALVEPLKELVYGRRGSMTSVSGILNRIRLFCTVYSPASERYRFSFGIFVGLIIGFISLAGTAFVLVRAGIRAYNERPTA